MISLQKFGQATLRLRRQVAANEEGNLSVESMLMIAVAAMILMGVMNIVGVDSSGDVSGGFFGGIMDFVPSLLGF